MLPFTKRPGRGDESGDNDVVTKDDIGMPSSTPRSGESKGTAKPSAAPASSPSGIAVPANRGKFVSVNDEEMTTLMSTKALGEARPSPRPAAGAPPPSRTAPPSRASTATFANRSGNFAAHEEEEDGRTVVRGAPKIVKRAPGSAAKMGMSTLPTTISPAAVIKATLESGRAGVKPKTDHLMAGPPIDLLEDLADRHPADAPDNTAILHSPPSSSQLPPSMLLGVKALTTQMLQGQAMPHGTIPPGSARPMSAPPPPMSGASMSGGYAAQSGSYAAQSGGYAAQSGGYAAHSGAYVAQYNGPVPSGSVSVPGVAMTPSMPAHFMVPQAPYSDARIDPPGTSVTSRTKVAGRPAASWAIALAAFGLFVGVGAVAVMNGNDQGGLIETGASFVDPSRANVASKAAAAAQAAPAAAPTVVPVAGVQPTTVGVPPVAVPAAAPASTEAVAAPLVTTPAAAALPAAAAPAAAPAAPATVAAAPTGRPAPPMAAAAPAAPRPAAAPAARPTRPAPQPEEPVAAAPTPAKGTKGAKPAAGAKGGSGDSAVDEEQRKALKALQESQLETPF